MSDWARESSMEKLLQIRVGYPSHMVEHRMADAEIRRREAEQAKKEAEDAAKIEAQRHQEAIALKKGAATKEEKRFQIQLDETRRQNCWTRVVAIAALVVSVLGFLAGIWMHYHPIALAPSATSTAPANSQMPTQTTPRP